MAHRLQIDSLGLRVSLMTPVLHEHLRANLQARDSTEHQDDYGPLLLLCSQDEAYR